MIDDPESRANRFIGSLDALGMLLAGQLPGDALSCDGLACLISLIGDEARKVIPDHAPRHAAPVNDDRR